MFRRGYRGDTDALTPLEAAFKALIQADRHEPWWTEEPEPTEPNIKLVK
jgi:hypothetical protein